MSDETDDKTEEARTYAEILNPALKELQTAFIRVVNEKEDISIFQEAVRKLDNARAVINSTLNLGLVVSIGRFTLVPFPLTGDQKRDLGQSPVDLPKIDEE